MKKLHKIGKKSIDIYQLLCYSIYWGRVYICIYKIYICYIYMVRNFLQLKVDNLNVLSIKNLCIEKKIINLLFWSGNSGNSGNRSRKVLKQQESNVTILPRFCYHCYHFPLSISKLTFRFSRAF